MIIVAPNSGWVEMVNIHLELVYKRRRREYILKMFNIGNPFFILKNDRQIFVGKQEDSTLF